MTSENTLPLNITIERYDRETFQREGHMLFQLYGAGDSPDAPPIRRPWGSEVFIATLKDPSGVQLCRAMSDSEDEAIKLLKLQIFNTLRANLKEAELRDFNYQQFLKLNEERNRFAQFLQSNYRREMESGKFATIFDLAAYYLRQERRRWRARIARWFQDRKTKPQLPGDQNEWIDQEWKQ